MFYTYIIYSPRLNRYYVGSTNNLQRRLDDHNRGKDKYTRQAKEWRLVFFEKYETRSEAVLRELEIKRKKSRVFIENLIRSFGLEHPD